MGNISVVTVTYNNAHGLMQTLRSLERLQHRPDEVIIIDGKSNDDTAGVVGQYSDTLNIIFVSEEDDGIYHAMNKGLRLASKAVVHYLNAGDTVYGEPYFQLNQPCLLPVQLMKDKCFGFAAPTIAGRSYCHQGIIFPASHGSYDQSYAIAADFALVLETFPRVAHVPVHSKGGVCYDLSGVSAVRRWQRDKEMAVILWRKRYWLLCLRFSLMSLVKLLPPKWLRQRFYQRKSIE